MDTGLSRAFLESGHTVQAVLPYYQCLPDSSIDQLQHVTDFEVPKVGLHKLSSTTIEASFVHITDIMQIMVHQESTLNIEFPSKSFPVVFILQKL